MNYRKRIADTTPSLEEVFINEIQIHVPVVSQTGSPSNKHTFHTLFFRHTDSYHYTTDESSNDTDYNYDVEYRKMFTESVFLDSFMESMMELGYTDTEPLYYIVHLDKSFPTGSKYSALLSNMANKNYSGKEQPPAIRKILHAIDYQKLTLHIEEMIEDRSADTDNLSLENNLRMYINDVLSLETKLADTCNRYSCHSSSDYLAWFLLYALFDDTNFDRYISENPPVAKHTETITPNIQDTEYGYDEALMTEHNRTRLLCKVSTGVMIVLFTLQIICLGFPLSIDKQKHMSSEYLYLYCIILLSISLFLLILRYIPLYFNRKKSEQELIMSAIYFKQWTPSFESHKMFHNNTRVYKNIWQNRRFIFVLLTMLIVLFIAFSVIAADFPLLLATISVFVVIFMYADCYLNDLRYYKKYDASFAPVPENRKADAQRGYAKIFRWDYDQITGETIHQNIYPQDYHSAECVRYILLSRIDRMNYSWIIYNMILFFINLVSLVAAISELVLPSNDYFRLTGQTEYLIFCLGITFITGIMNIIALLLARYHYTDITRLHYYATSPDMTEHTMQKLYANYLIRGTIDVLDISRGVYNYNSMQFDKHTPIDDIVPEFDRMNMQHQNIARRHRSLIAFCLLYITFFCIVIWHMHILRAIWITPFLIILYYIYSNLLIPLLNLHRLKKALHKLNN
ncbi:MAG: hypothetical protein ACI39Q_07310 [Wujia sp.]